MKRPLVILILALIAGFAAFGITRKPLNDWLDFAASGLPRQGPAFSTELEDANIRNQQRELQSMQLQRDLASEEAASNFLSQAAGKNFYYQEKARLVVADFEHQQVGHLEFLLVVGCSHHLE